MDYDDRRGAGDDESNGSGSQPDYEVGFGKPPLHSRFKKGFSGNPKGRKKLQKELDRLKELAQAKVEVVINGEKVKISTREAMIRANLAKALKGSTRDALNVVELLSKIGVPLVSEEEKQSLDGSMQQRAFEELEKLRKEIFAIDEHYDLMQPYREKQKAMVLGDPDVIERQILFWVEFLEEAANEAGFNTRLEALKAEKREALMSEKLIKKITRRYRERLRKPLDDLD